MISGIASPRSIGQSSLTGSEAMREVKAPDDGSFGAVFDLVLNNVGTPLKAAEQTATQGILGQASVQETVQAVMSAEQSLQVGIGIRDRIVNAYVELSRMAI